MGAVFGQEILETLISDKTMSLYYSVLNTAPLDSPTIIYCKILEISYAGFNWNHFQAYLLSPVPPPQLIHLPNPHLGLFTET